MKLAHRPLGRREKPAVGLKVKDKTRLAGWIDLTGSNRARVDS